MRLVSYAAAAGGAWRAGLVIDGHVVDAAELDGRLTSVRAILALEAGERSSLERSAAGAAPGAALDAVVLGPPVPDPQKILCLGLNYLEHAREAGQEIPPVPVLFPKFPNALIGSGEPIVLPRASREVDYEGELAVVIGRRCRQVDARSALSCVGGYMPFNDVSARDLQMRTSQWTAGKISDTFAPCGPWLTTADEVADPQALDLTTELNGRAMQRASTSDMIFGVAEAIAFVSTIVTLEVGDIIATGTPSGVGFSRTPPVFLADGDEVEIEISGLGRLRNAVTGAT